jgi:hypothetical protein
LYICIRHKDADRARKQVVGKNGVGLHPYPCKYCGAYHVGHSAPIRLKRTQDR